MWQVSLFTKGWIYFNALFFNRLTAVLSSELIYRERIHEHARRYKKERQWFWAKWRVIKWHIKVKCKLQDQTIGIYLSWRTDMKMTNHRWSSPPGCVVGEFSGEEPKTGLKWFQTSGPWIQFYSTSHLKGVGLVSDYDSVSRSYTQSRFSSLLNKSFINTCIILQCFIHVLIWFDVKGLPCLLCPF